MKKVCWQGGGTDEGFKIVLRIAYSNKKMSEIRNYLCRDLGHPLFEHLVRTFYHFNCSCHCLFCTRIMCMDSRGRLAQSETVRLPIQQSEFDSASRRKFLSHCRRKMHNFDLFKHLLPKPKAPSTGERRGIFTNPLSERGT